MSALLSAIAVVVGAASLAAGLVLFVVGMTGAEIVLGRLSARLENYPRLNTALAYLAVTAAGVFLLIAAWSAGLSVLETAGVSVA